MPYEQLVHDQSLYCCNQSLELSKQLAKLNRKKLSESRTIEAQQIQKLKTSNEIRIASLRYIYRTANREDLEQLMFDLTHIMMDDTYRALADPKGWKEACDVAGFPQELDEYEVPEKELQQWRMKFITAIQRNT